MQQLADRLFPQTAALEGDVLSRAAFDQGMTELASENFKDREAAQQRLSLGGGLYWEEMALAAGGGRIHFRQKKGKIKACPMARAGD